MPSTHKFLIVYWRKASGSKEKLYLAAVPEKWKKAFKGARALFKCCLRVTLPLPHHSVLADLFISS